MARSPNQAFLNKWSRKLHRWGAIGSALPVFIIIVTGLMLQLKKQLPWVQPPTQRGESGAPTLALADILRIAASVPEAQIQTWDDIDRLDVRPSRGLVKVRGRNRWEVQIDLRRGTILQSMYRRSDWIESLHDGSWFHSQVKLLIFLPAALVLLTLWITGIYLWVLPLLTRRQRQRRHASLGRDRPGRG